jgi:hypothetical protein
MSGCVRSAALVAIAIGLGAPASAQTEPALATVLERAGAYVVEFQRRLSGIVAEERYRLAKLFLEPTRSTAEQVHRIVADSARYNIGGVVRTVNVPVMPLVFLEPARQTRFTFRRTANAVPSMSFPRNAATAWTIQYQEADRNTMIRGTNGFDLPAHGRFWIEPDTGRVLMSELMVDDAVLRAVIVVKYVEEQAAALLVPLEMRERYDVHDAAVRHRGSEVDGTATYSKFRQFTVTVDETLAPVVKR